VRQEEEGELRHPPSKRVRTSSSSAEAQQPQEQEQEQEQSRERGWTTLLQETQVGELCHRNLVTIGAKDPLSLLLQRLEEHNILSCPVLSHTTHHFLGFVDTLDIAGFVLSTWKKHSRGLDAGKFPGARAGAGAGGFFETTVDKLLDFSRVGPSVVVSEETSLLDAIDIFSDPHMHLRLHRLAVVDSNRRTVLGIISQSDIIAFAHKHVKSFPPEMVTPFPSLPLLLLLLPPETPLVLITRQA